MFVSTRGQSPMVDGAEAILQGLAPDGGLYVPVTFPALPDIRELLPLTYAQRAARVMAPYLDGYTVKDVEDCVTGAYESGKFDPGSAAPVVKLRDGQYVLELWHGPTCAFKDMALQVLPRLMGCAQNKRGGKVMILVATSGDTGKAALEGFANVADTRIGVFYPHGGVSHTQEMQMRTQQGDNTHVVAVKGNFDDCQTGVKKLFGSKEFSAKAKEAGWQLSSANSINFGRLVPQIAYYVSAYCDLVNEGVISVGDEVDFAVPTGNFGNILAGEYARRMGLPIRKLLCASNKNHVLTDFFATGVYDVARPFYLTPSPSMDILVSSNLERLLFELCGRDGDKVRGWMELLSQKKPYSLDEADRAALSGFDAGWADVERARESIARAWKNEGYLMDPHTAVAQAVAEDWAGRDDKVPMIVVSTAHPYKFGPEVAAAIGFETDKQDFELLDALAAETGVKVPAPLDQVRRLPVRHSMVCEVAEMDKAVWTKWED